MQIRNVKTDAEKIESELQGKVRTIEQNFKYVYKHFSFFELLSIVFMQQHSSGCFKVGTMFFAGPPRALIQNQRHSKISTKCAKMLILVQNL